MTVKQNRQGMSRRDFLRASAGVAGMAVIAACASPAGQAPTGEEGEMAGAEVVTISFMGWGGPGEDNGVRAAIEVFEEEQAGIKVEWLHTPDNYQEKFLTNVAAGTPPDTAFIGSGEYRTYVRDDLLMDITDFLEGDPLLGAEDYFIQPQEGDRCSTNGRWHGIGSCWVAPHIYYNADIFEAEGIEGPSERSG